MLYLDPSWSYARAYYSSNGYLLPDAFLSGSRSLRRELLFLAMTVAV
jgi:hypothetical protein